MAYYKLTYLNDIGEDFDLKITRANKELQEVKVIAGMGGILSVGILLDGENSLVSPKEASLIETVITELI